MAEIRVPLGQHNGRPQDNSYLKVEPGDEGHTLWITVYTEDGRTDVTVLPNEARFIAAALEAAADEVERR